MANTQIVIDIEITEEFIQDRIVKEVHWLLLEYESLSWFMKLFIDKRIKRTVERLKRMSEMLQNIRGDNAK